MNVFLAPEFARYYEKHPLVLVDVGAGGGLQHNWRPASKYLRVIGFEPDDRAYAELASSQNGSFTYLHTALHNTSGESPLHLSRKQTVSSMLSPDGHFLARFPEAERFEIVQTVCVKVDTLDHQLSENQIHDADFVKLDAQGAELFILQGSTATLSNAVFGLEVEVEFVPIYQDQPLFADVDAYLRGFDFQLFDLRPEYWKRSLGKDCGGSKGQIIFADALYFRSPESLLRLLSRIPDAEARQSKLLRAVSICLLYGYADYAMEVLTLAGPVLHPNELEAALRAVRSSAQPARRMPDFRGRRRVANLLYSLWRLFQPTAHPSSSHYDYHGWATGTTTIGNVD